MTATTTIPLMKSDLYETYVCLNRKWVVVEDMGRAEFQPQVHNKTGGVRFGVIHDYVVGKSFPAIQILKGRRA